MIKKKRIPLLLIVVFYTIFFIFQNINWMGRDAQYFSKIKGSAFVFALKRYESWSSRFWLEGATVVASKNLVLFLSLQQF